MSPEAPDIQQRLLEAIREPRNRSRVELLIELCTTAVQDLACLDNSIYEEYGARAKTADGQADEKTLEELANVVLGGARGLNSYLASSDFAEPAKAEDSEEDDDFDFDFGSADDTLTDISIGDDDIAGALGFLAPEEGRSSKDRWKELSGELNTLSYALGSQLKDFDERFSGTVAAHQTDQALRLLHDICSTMTDGIFELMSTIYGAYLGEVDRNQLIPGHRDTLQRALLVRRGLAELRRAINHNNSCVQDTSAASEDREQALDQIREALNDFFDDEAFDMMRPADRNELVEFGISLDGKNVSQGLLVCEGLDKYLDSLAVVNQRDVLIQYDREVKNEIAELLEGAEPLFDISPHGAIDLVRGAYDKAATLRGSSDHLDGLLDQWETGNHGDDPKAVLEAGKELAQTVGPAN